MANHDSEESVMSGGFSVSLSKRKMRNYSLPWSPYNDIGDKQPELMSNSDHSIFSSTITTTGFFKPRNFKRARVDLGLIKPCGNKCSVPSSNFENTKLPLTKRFSKANLSTPHDEWPQSSQCWRKKPDSVNRPYNRYNNSNYAAVGGHKLDSSVSKLGFRPYDICFHGRRNHALTGASLLGENKESRIEMQQEYTKGSVLRPGMVLLKNFISHDEQVLHFHLL